MTISIRFLPVALMLMRAAGVDLSQEHLAIQHKGAQVIHGACHFTTASGFTKYGEIGVLVLTCHSTDRPEHLAPIYATTNALLNGKQPCETCVLSAIVCLKTLLLISVHGNI